jgi:integrase
MASVISDPNGRKRIQFTAGDGSRRTIRLGKATVKQAEAIKVKIDQLVLTATGVTGVVDEATISWLGGLDDCMYNKLATVGLIGPRENSTKLGTFLKGYIEERSDTKPATQISYRQAANTLIDFFGSDKLLRNITTGEADQWRAHLVEKKLAIATVRRRCGLAKQFFKVAVRRRLISSNPFEDLKAAVQGNPARFYYITRAEADKVLDACPDSQWRLIFALCRYGGLRCPSEHLLLRWADIDWDRNKMLVRSPKTEHRIGHESRFVPIFPELLPYLHEVFEQAEPSNEYVITRYKKTNCNLRTQLERIIIKAGLKPWPKMFQNLRSTRQTELTERWPEHVVCAWIGNSKAVAREHYLQVTDEHFEQAAKIFTGNTKGLEKATQNPTQQDAALPRNTPIAVGKTAFFDVKRDPATPCECQMGRVGIEPT